MSEKAEDMLTLAVAAQAAGVGERTMYRLMDTGLPVYKFPRDIRPYVRLEEVKAALAALPPARRRPRRWRSEAAATSPQPPPDG